MAHEAATLVVSVFVLFKNCISLAYSGVVEMRMAQSVGLGYDNRGFIKDDAKKVY